MVYYRERHQRRTSMTQHSALVFQSWLSRPAKFCAIALTLALTLTLLSCTGTNPPDLSAEAPADSTADSTADSIVNEAEPTAEEVAAAEAEQRAEWEAQQAKTQAVISELSREELIADSSTKGPKDADVILLKFSDFECPFCAQAAADMKDFTEKHDDILYVYKQLPLESIHPEAMPAAKASWAAGQQDQFWIYHDGLFAFQDKLSEDYYVELAEQIGLDIEQFNRDRNSPEAAAAIEKDIQLARDLALRGTPTFVMNELLIPGGAPPEFFEEAVKRAKDGTLIE